MTLPPGGGSPRDRFPLLRWLIVTIIAVGMPVALLFVVGFQRLTREARLATDRLRDRLEDHYGFLDAKQDVGHAQIWLQRLLPPPGPGLRGQRRIARAIRYMHRVFPGVFQFVVLDGRGDAVASLSEVHLDQARSRPFFADTVAAARDQNGGAYVARRVGLHRPWIGPLYGRNGGEMIFAYRTDASVRLRRHWFITMKPSEHGLIAIFVNREPRGMHSGMNLILGALRRSDCSLRGGIIDLHRHGPHSRRLWGDAMPDVDLALARMGRSSGDVVQMGSRVWVQKVISSQYRAVLMLVDPDTETRQQRMHMIYVICMLLLGVGAMGSYRVAFGAVPVTVSLKHQLGALFMFAIGVPLGLLWVATSGLLEERERLLHDVARTHLEQRLRAYDAQFATWLGNLEGRLRKELQASTALANEQLMVASAAEALSRVRSTELKSVTGLMDARGNRLYSDGELGSLAGMMRLAGPLIIARMNRARPDARPNPMAEIVGATSEASGIDLEGFISQLQQTSGQISEITMGIERMQMFLMPLEWAGEARALGFVVWARGQLLRQFFNGTEGVRNRLFGRGRFVLRHSSWDCNLPEDPYRLRSWSERLGPVLVRRGLPISRYRPTRRAGLLLVGICGAQIRGARLFACMDDADLRRELARIDRAFFGVAGFLLLVGAAAGFLLRREILEPIAVLGQGITALQHRKFDVRLPQTTHDELGRLVGAFNGMMEGLADLEVGRAVAENLFPRESLQLGASELFGRSEAASRMGGDWFDYRALDAQRALVTLGDVTGHGTGPALVVAMAKALMILLADLRQPGEILAAMNRTLFGVLRRRYYMTLLIAVIDLERGELALANAGQCCPVRVRRGKVETLEATGFPVGAMRLVNPVVTVHALEPGDALVFYTDGLIEARLVGSEDAIGLERFAGALPGLLGPDAVATIRGIQSWQKDLSGPGEPEDDITVVVWQPRNFVGLDRARELSVGVGA